MGEALGEMHGRRQQADYEMGNSTIRSKAEQTIGKAEDYLRRLDATTKPLVGNAVEAYFKKRSQPQTRF